MVPLARAEVYDPNEVAVAHVYTICVAAPVSCSHRSDAITPRFS